MKPNLVFVYNADSGLFNALTGIAHKIFSPQTYPCNLCALTHSNLGMRAEWKRFVESLNREVEFLHADELKARGASDGLRLPVVLERRGDELKTLLDAETINACRSLDELERALLDKLSYTGLQ